MEELISEYADCFALSMSEVTLVEGAHHQFNIPKDHQFRTCIRQRALMPQQQEYFNMVLDTMLATDIIEPIDYQDVKCCSATTLAQKAHDRGGLMLEELQHKVNDECIAAGLDRVFDLPPWIPKAEAANSKTASKAELPKKWRVCQDFQELNKVMKVLPLPQGDI